MLGSFGSIIPKKDYFYQGRLGNEITTEQGFKAMELYALNVLAQIDKKVGFDKIIGLNHIGLVSGEWYHSFLF